MSANSHFDQRNLLFMTKILGIRGQIAIGNAIQDVSFTVTESKAKKYLLRYGEYDNGWDCF